jgi:hypothetical protein
MIIRLDSIEEESMMADENNNSNGMGYVHNVNMTKTNTTFKSKSKDSHKDLMKKFDDDF